MNSENIRLFERQGYWYAQFYHYDHLSSKLKEHVENTGLHAIPVLQRKALRKAKSIYDRIAQNQQKLTITLDKPSQPKIDSNSVLCPDVSHDKGNPMNLIKKRNGYWYMNFSYTKSNGEVGRCRQSTKLAATRNNKPEALRMALAMRTALLQSEEESPKKNAKKQSSSKETPISRPDIFDSVAKEYIKTLEAKGLRKSTLKGYRSMLRIHLLPQFGKTPVSDIKTRRVDKWFSSLKGHNNKPLSGKTRNNIINFLAEIMSKAVAWEYCKENPIKSISRSKLQEKEMLFWSEKERDTFLSTVSEHSPEHFPLFATFLFTGMRVGEVLALKWEHINLAKSTIIICSNYVEKETTNPKSGTFRFIQICPFLCDVLQNYKEATGKQKGLVFPTPAGKNSSNDRIRRPFERLVKKANVKKIRIHDMRHTFASLALMAGVDVPTVQKWLGHKDIQTTMRYIKLLPEHMQEQAKKLTANIRFNPKNDT